MEAIRIEKKGGGALTTEGPDILDFWDVVNVEEFEELKEAVRGRGETQEQSKPTTYKANLVYIPFVIEGSLRKAA